MKLRKLLIIILVVGLLAVYYVFGTDYRELRRNNAVLASQIAGAAKQLALLPLPPADIQQRQAAAGDALEKERNTFPADTNTTRIVNAVLKLAEGAGVKAVPLITQPWARESVSQTEYPVFRLNIAAGGTFAQVSEFLNRLESEEPGTLVISNLKVDRAEGQASNESDPAVNTNVQVSLDIAVYARPAVIIPSDKVGNK